MKLPGTPTPMKIWIASDGIEIAGDHWGNPSGPLVILQHGGGQTARRGGDPEAEGGQDRSRRSMYQQLVRKDGIIPDLEFLMIMRRMIEPHAG